MAANQLLPFDGKLSKYTNVMKGWQNRYFILNPQQGILEYHISQSEAMSSHYKPRGSLLLAGAVIAPSIEDSFTFSVNAANGEVYKLRATNTKERQEWMSKLRAVAYHFTAQIAQEHPPLATSSKPRTRSVVSNLSTNLNKIKDQVQHLSTTGPPNTSSAATRQRANEHAGGNALHNHDGVNGSHKSNGRARADSRSSTGRSIRTIPSTDVKKLQTSDLQPLQDAREVLVSADNYHAGLVSMLDSLYYPPDQRYEANLDTSSQNSTDDPQHQCLALDKDVLLVKSTSTAMLQSLNNCYALLQKYHQHLSSVLPPDAEISWVEPRKPTPSVNHQKQTTGNDVVSFEVPSIADPNDEVEDPSSVHEDELGAVDEHKNIIMHLLSQLKLGMDLTKVTLPTFILEKRSLLEMYADFVGHAELLLAIPSGSTPEERMQRVLKFYLSSFHSGRHGQIAKKPYNPIVGEVFQCSYYVPKESNLPDNISPSAETHHRIRFLSEQVSHHPPVSAFFVSCPDKGIQLNSHIWTKSRFMNMSVGVNNVGEGILSLSEHNEDYVMTYPSAYARSILTVPWSELGGRCSISCEQTGLSTNVVFHTKPMYGGQPHRVTAEVKNNAGFVSCRADGKWNAELEFVYYKQSEGDTFTGAANELKENSEVLDTNQLQTFRKYVRPFDMQSRMESRKLWHNVTESLKNGDVPSATLHKTALEDQQRDMEKQRQEAQLPVATAYFTHTKGKDYDIYNHKEFLM